MYINVPRNKAESQHYYIIITYFMMHSLKTHPVFNIIIPKELMIFLNYGMLPTFFISGYVIYYQSLLK